MAENRKGKMFLENIFSINTHRRYFDTALSAKLSCEALTCNTNCEWRLPSPADPRRCFANVFADIRGTTLLYGWHANCSACSTLRSCRSSRGRNIRRRTTGNSSPSNFVTRPRRTSRTKSRGYARRSYLSTRASHVIDFRFRTASVPLDTWLRNLPVYAVISRTKIIFIFFALNFITLLRVLFTCHLKRNCEICNYVLRYICWQEINNTHIYIYINAKTQTIWLSKVAL